MLARAPETVDVDELRTRGWTKVNLGWGPTPHATGGFGTPDGKLAFRVDTLTTQGLDPLPDYQPPAEVTDAQRAERFPFALLTPKTHFFLNTTFANLTRQRVAQGDPVVFVHADDARDTGVADGQQVRVSNERGAFVATARVSDDTMPGVLVAPMGWWSGDHADRLGPQSTTSQRLTTIAKAPTFNDTRVALAPTAGEGSLSEDGTEGAENRSPR